jgi:hypothetical protein
METKNRVIKLTDNAQLLIKIVIAIATIGGGGGTVFAAKKVGEKYFPEQMEQIREVLGIDEKATPELISEKEKVIQDILERTISEVDNTILPELQEGSDITIWYEDNEKDAYKKIKSEHAISGLPVEFQEGDGITTTYTGDERKAYEDLKNKHEEKREEEENKRESELKEQLRDLEKIRNDFHNGSKAQKTA